MSKSGMIEKICHPQPAARSSVLVGRSDALARCAQLSVEQIFLASRIDQFVVGEEQSCIIRN